MREMTERVYDELRAIARRRLAGERRNHTLQATALVHEALLRLRDESQSDPRRFYAAAATAMRRILVEHARARGAAKRGGDRQRLDDGVLDLRAAPDAAGTEELTEALDRLAGVDPRAAEVVDLRFFAGLSFKEIAELLAVSERTVLRDWSWARTWLYDALQ